jgi:phosphopantothenoylcysteine decarboxylase/phosphopantothenate--cysteine ligase
MLEGKKILLGITGSIAAYKSIYLVRQLIKAGAEVKVILTPSARDFVPILTLSTLSRNKVLVDLFEDDSWSNHVMLGRWADLMIIAPLSCNTLAKMATGQCDNLLLATWLSAVCPVVVAPAMDEDMWKHPATKENISRLGKFGNQVIPAENGDLASGLVGEGRMAEPDHIISFISSRFFLTKPLRGKKALVTAGPTYEPIDPVRFIGNQSSGKMGVAIANELHERGAEVTLVLGPSQLAIQSNGIVLEKVVTAEQMYQACEKHFSGSDITVMAAAVADYTPGEPSMEKIKKKDNTLKLELQKTKDILRSMGEKKRKDQVLVGFALETGDGVEYAKEKLRSKNADLLVLNTLADTGAGFATDTNKITIFDRKGESQVFPLKSKSDVARDIVDTIINRFYAK